MDDATIIFSVIDLAMFSLGVDHSTYRTPSRFVPITATPSAGSGHGSLDSAAKMFDASMRL